MTNAWPLLKGFHRLNAELEDIWRLENAGFVVAVSSIVDRIVNWIPSHLDRQLCETLFEEWVSERNSKADRNAVLANRNRSEPFQLSTSCAR